MKKFLILAALVTAPMTTSVYAADVGVSISIGQPGFFGQIDIGDFPRPQVINVEPIMVERGYGDRPPIYLRVPPEHQKHWRKHCQEYHACGERVLFVKDEWYKKEYIPRYQEQQGRGHGEGRREERMYDRREERQDERHEQKREREQNREHDQGRNHEQGREQGQGREHERDH